MDPFIDFSKLEDFTPPEGVSVDALNSQAVQQVLQDQFDANFQSRYDTQAAGLVKTNQQLKAEKTAAKQAMEELKEQYKDIDPDKYNQLLELEKNNGDATQQLATARQSIESLQTELQQEKEARTGERKQFSSTLTNYQRDTFIGEAIREFNATNEQVSLKPGNEQWLLQEAARVWRGEVKKDEATGAESTTFTPMGDGEKVLMGRGGQVMTGAEWVNSLRDRAGFKDMFRQPEGGGSGGSGGSGGNSGSLTGDAKQRSQHFADKFNLPVS